MTLRHWLQMKLGIPEWVAKTKLLERRMDEIEAYLDNLDIDMKEAVPEILELVSDVATTLEATTRIAGDTDQRLRYYEKHSATINTLYQRLLTIRKNAAAARAQLKGENHEQRPTIDDHASRRPPEAEVPQGEGLDAPGEVR